MSQVPIDHILELPTAERIAIVQEIWESMVESPDSVEITAAQREELERRWIDFQRNPDDGELWSDVKKSLRDDD
jgi:putative addiction module component (TIGR02574 family)